MSKTTKILMCVTVIVVTVCAIIIFLLFKDNEKPTENVESQQQSVVVSDDETINVPDEDYIDFVNKHLELVTEFGQEECVVFVNKLATFLNKYDQNLSDVINTKFEVLFENHRPYFFVDTEALHIKVSYTDLEYPITYSFERVD